MSMLRRIVVPLLLAASVALTGCASLKQATGSNVQEQKDIVHKRQEPWHNLTLVGDVSKMMAYRVAYIAFPKPLPREWKEELVDPTRAYLVKRFDGTETKKILERVVFRALAYRGEEFVEMFDAVLNPSATGLFVLLPPGGEYDGINLVVVPSDAAWLMTTHGETVPLAEGQMLERLPEGFFEKHPSPLRQMTRMDRANKDGKKFFAELEGLFPRLYSAGGFDYSGRPDTKIVSKFTRVDQPFDRLVSCGSFPVSTGMVSPLLVISAARNVYIMGKTDCFK
jgi:hypothetical protein